MPHFTKLTLEANKTLALFDAVLKEIKLHKITKEHALQQISLFDEWFFDTLNKIPQYLRAQMDKIHRAWEARKEMGYRACKVAYKFG